MLLAEVQYQKNGTFVRTLKFLHDENGAVIGISVKNAGETSFTSYYYAKNLQGDVVAVYRSDYTEAKGYYPTLVASYEYDPWGKVIAVKGSAGTVLSLEAYPNHIAHVNPIRYRGYYYDNETGFYYLQSRYYDPVISRFINADSYGSTGQGFLGTNMFAYCANNPVNMVDPSGHFLIEAWLYELLLCSLGAAAIGIAAKAASDVIIGTTQLIQENINYATKEIKTQLSVQEQIELKYEIERKYEDDDIVFWGVDLYGGTMNQKTGGMTFEEAAIWAGAQAHAGTYTARAAWGLYTANATDAAAMAYFLGVPTALSDKNAILTLHLEEDDHLSHYHTEQKMLLGVPAPSFHVWFSIYD